MIRLTYKLVTAFLVIISGCAKDNEKLTCTYTDFKYYQGEPSFLGEMSGEFILVGSDTSNSDSSISTFIKSYNSFDQSYDFRIEKYSDYKYKQIILKFRQTLNCKNITAIIADIKENEIVDYTHFTIKTDNCTNWIGEPLGERCVNSYSNLFYVKVKDPNSLSDLYNTIDETNTVLIEQDKFMSAWYTLGADKNSQGDAMQMANYFYETGLFEASEPDIIKFAVE